MNNELLSNQKIEKNRIELRGVSIGGKEPVIIAGPCTVESEEQIFTSAKYLKDLGVDILRGGCFKPRTSPYSFQGLEEEGIRLLSEAGKRYELPIISELISLEQLERSYNYIDIVQVGSRNMYNYPLLKELGKLQKPVLLKRAFAATYEEWILAAEYIVLNGNKDVILCERGIRTFEQATRNNLDITAVPYIQSRTPFPIIVDPSHACGMREFVKPLSLSAIAAGADGLMIEVHPKPEQALCDGMQSLDFQEFAGLFHSVKHLAAWQGQV